MDVRYSSWSRPERTSSAACSGPRSSSRPRSASPPGELSSAELKRVEDRAVDEAHPAPGGRRARRRHGRRDAPALVPEPAARRRSTGSVAWNLDAFLWGEWRSDELGDLVVERPPLAVVDEAAPEAPPLRGGVRLRPRTHRTAILKVTHPQPEPLRQLLRARALPRGLPHPGGVPRRRRRAPPRGGGRARPARRHVHPARRAALPPAARSALPGLLREPGVAGGAVARPRPRARQPRHRRPCRA